MLSGFSGDAVDPVASSPAAFMLSKTKISQMRMRPLIRLKAALFALRQHDENDSSSLNK